jgi:hypothetical protein
MKTPEQIKSEVREVREHTARIRSALKVLPSWAREEGWDETSEKDHLTDILQEIIGSATHIADLLGVEL